MTLCSALAYAADATLVSPAAGVSFEQAGVITLQVADSVSDDRYANFFVQFDGDDITSLVAVNGRTVTYQPPVKLAPGDHTLILIEKTGETFAELARWTINAGGVSGPAATAGGGDGTGAAAAPANNITGEFAGQYNYLLSDNLEQDDKIKPHSGTASLTTQGHFTAGGWQTDAKFSGLFDSKENNNAPDDDHFLLGEYLVTAKNAGEKLTTTLNLGNHDAGISNLIVDQYYRRGASARFDIGEWARLTGFAQDPARAIGNSNVSGVARQEQRAEGGALRLFPFASTYGERIFVEGAGYHGEGTIAGDGSGVPSNLGNEGSGWTAAVEGQTLNDKVNARADFAETKFDEDGASTLLNPENDKAYRARLVWAPIATLLQSDTSPEKLQFATSFQRYGTFYRSLANTGAPVDEKRLAFSGSFLKDQLSATAETYAVENNVENDIALPTDRGYGGLLNATVQPVFFWSGIKPESFLGRSTWVAGTTLTRELRHETPAGFVGDNLDQGTFTVNGGWTVAYDKVTATLAHTYTVFDNDAVKADSYHTNFTELSATWAVNDRFTVTPSAQLQWQHDAGPATNTEQVFAALDTSAVLIPEKLTHTFHYSGLFDHGTAADDQHNLATEFVWQVKQGALNDPGYAIALSGAYDHQTRDALPPASDKDEIYKVLISLKVGAAFGF